MNGIFLKIDVSSQKTPFFSTQLTIKNTNLTLKANFQYIKNESTPTLE